MPRMRSKDAQREVPRLWILRNLISLKIVRVAIAKCVESVPVIASFRNDIMQMCSDSRLGHKLSINRFLLLGTWLATTNIVIYQTVLGTLTETLFGLYLGTFAATNVINKISAIKKGDTKNADDKP